MAGRITTISISTRGDAKARTRYYRDRAAAQGLTGYYNTEAVPLWISFADETLTGLGITEREATDEQVERLLLGLHPTRDEQLGRPGVDSRSGQSVVTSHDWTSLPLPKSVSVIWALSNRTMQSYYSARALA